MNLSPLAKRLSHSTRGAAAKTEADVEERSRLLYSPEISPLIGKVHEWATFAPDILKPTSAL